MTTADLFTPLALGPYTLSHRVVMAPLTRMRATQPGEVANDMMARYYGQRATEGGLIIAEASQVTPVGRGAPCTPGIHSQQQTQGWKLVTDAIHAKGGLVFLQLWHVGRISHSSHQPEGGLPVAPSAIRPSGKTFTATWKQVDFETPHALSIPEIEAIIADYKHAAENAKKAGFDGVEVHGANGYLPDQFLQTGSNQRTDAYGGGIENRARFLLEAVDAAISVWGAGRVGVRLSPYGTFNDMHDEDPIALFTYVLEQLSARGIAYVHVIEPRATGAGGSDAIKADAPAATALFRSHFEGAFISAGGYTPQTAREAVENGHADAVAFGRYFISNPDLPARIQQEASLTPYQRATFYGGTEKGYTDYPFFQEAAA